MKFYKKLQLYVDLNLYVIIFLIIANLLMILSNGYFNLNYVIYLEDYILAYFINSIILIFICVYFIQILPPKQRYLNTIIQILQTLFLLYLSNYFFSDKLLYNLILNLIVIILCIKLSQRILYDK